MTKKNIFSFFFSMFFILMMANPALTNEDGVKGICMGGGEWFAVFDPQVVGNTSFSMRANFPGNASGGQVYVSFPDKSFIVVDVDPDFSVILDRVWMVTDSLDPYSYFEVEGYAFWGIGPVVATNKEDWEGKWALVGAYDGSEYNESDYLRAIPGLSQGPAETFYGQSVNGSIPLWVVLDKGNATIIVMEEP